MERHFKAGIDRRESRRSNEIVFQPAMSAFGSAAERRRRV